MDDLPVLKVLPTLLETLEKGTGAVLVAPPGAGKTTAVAPALLTEDWCTGEILLLSPRRVAARAAAERMAELLGERAGETIGYATRLDSKRSARTRVTVVTEAIFVNRIVDDPELEGISAVLFDEAHERNLDTDLGLALALESRSVLRDDLRLERIGLPQVQGVGGLHVVVAVEQHVRPVAGHVADHHRVTRGGAFLGLDTHRAQVLDQPVGGLLALRLVRGVGRDRRDRQQVAQPVERLRQIVVDAGQDGFQAHARGSLKAGAGRSDATLPEAGPVSSAPAGPPHRAERFPIVVLFSGLTPWRPGSMTQMSGCDRMSIPDAWTLGLWACIHSGN